MRPGPMLLIEIKPWLLLLLLPLVLTASTASPTMAAASSAGDSISDYDVGDCPCASAQAPPEGYYAVEMNPQPDEDSERFLAPESLVILAESHLIDFHTLELLTAGGGGSDQRRYTISELLADRYLIGKFYLHHSPALEVKAETFSFAIEIPGREEIQPLYTYYEPPVATGLSSGRSRYYCIFERNAVLAGEPAWIRVRVISGEQSATFVLRGPALP